MIASQREHRTGHTTRVTLLRSNVTQKCKSTIAKMADFVREDGSMIYTKSPGFKH